MTRSRQRRRHPLPVQGWTKQRTRAEARPTKPRAVPPELRAGHEEVGMYRLVEEVTGRCGTAEVKSRPRGTGSSRSRRGVAAALGGDRAVPRPSSQRAKAAWEGGEAQWRRKWKPRHGKSTSNAGRDELEKARRGLIEEPAGAVAAGTSTRCSPQSWLRRRMLRILSRAGAGRSSGTTELESASGAVRRPPRGLRA